MLSRLLLLFLATVTLPGAAQTAELTEPDWPQFRRDARRTGDNPQARLAWPLERITAVQFPAPIYASPAVVDGRVYIQDARGLAACIDAAANRALWTTHLGGFNSTSSPAVTGGKVYVGSATGALFILDAASGKVLGRVPAEGGVLTAPAVANDSVYFSTFAGKLVKIDLAGNVIWTFSGGRMSTAEIAVLERDILFFAGSTNTHIYRLRDEGAQVRLVSKISAPSNCCPMSGPVFISDDSFAFQSFDSEFGRFYWMAKGKTHTITDISDSRVVPAVRGELVYRGDKCFSLVPGLKQVWRTEATQLYDGGFHSSPALASEVQVVGCERGLVHFYPLQADVKTRKPLWQFSTVRAGQPNSAVSSSPAVIDGKVFFGGEDGILYGLGRGKDVDVVDLAAANNQEVARPMLKGSEWPTPGGDMGFSYVSTDREVKPPFEIAWKSRIWSVFKAPMIVADNKVFCGGRLGNLTALDARTGEILWKVHHAGVESRPAPTYVDGKLLIMRTQTAQGDSPYISGASGGPRGEGLWCHDAATGRTLWHRPMKFKYHFNHDGLAVDRGLVFVEEFDKAGVELAAFAIDSGREVWRRPLDGILPVSQSKLKLPPRFSGVLVGGLWCVSISDQITLALNPADGEIVWSNKDLHITKRSRIAGRDGVLVVFNAAGDHAVDARTGKPLWKGAATASPYSQALTDRYLQSKGQQGIYPVAACAWPVFANGHWYSHYSFTLAHGSNRLAVVKEPEIGEVGLLGPKMVVWTHDFLSNACPAPSPAYGRLYYSPASEGVIYCFTPTAGKKAAE